MKTRIIALTTVATITLALLGYLLIDVLLPLNLQSFRQSIRVPSPSELHTYLSMRSAVTTVNAGLLALLLSVYIGVYRKTHAEFSIGLIIFTTILLLYSVTSGPLIYLLSLHFRVYGLGALAALPELLTTVAVIVLLYLSLK